MKKLISVVVFIVVFVVVSAGSKALVDYYIESQEKPQDTAQAREAYKKLYVDACIQGGGEYGVYPGFSDYCGCTFDSAEQITGAWQKVGSYTSNLNEQDLTTLAAPCMYHIQQA